MPTACGCTAWPGPGAIIGTADGNQRLVVVGREVVPGLRPRGRSASIMRSSAPRAATYRLGFDGLRAAGEATAARRRRRPAARRRCARRRCAIASGWLRVSAGGRVTGHAVRAGASVPALARAGMRAGDVIRARQRLRIRSGTAARNSPGPSPIRRRVDVRDRAGRTADAPRHRALIVTSSLQSVIQKYCINI